MPKLEIGPSQYGKIDSSWETIDCVENRFADKIINIRKHPLKIESNKYDIVYASHVLEHIPWEETFRVLKELKRIIKKDGVIEIWVPDLKKLVSAYLNNSLIKNDGWYKYNSDRDPTRWFNGRLFSYGNNPHRTAFDERYLRKCLLEVGFKNLTKLNKPRGYNHGWINLGIKGVK